MTEPPDSDLLTIAAAAYPLDRFDSLRDYEAKLSAWVAEAAGQGADLLVFPEYAAMELASLGGAAVAADLEGALSEVARHDLGGGAIDGFNPTEHPATHDEAADDAEQQHQAAAETNRVDEQCLGSQLVLDVARHQQLGVLELDRAAEKPPGTQAALGVDGETYPIGDEIVALWEEVEIAGNGEAVLVDQQIDAVHAGLGGGALGDDAAETEDPEIAVLLLETGELGLNGLLGLPLHEIDGGDVDERQQGERRDREDREIADGQPESGGVKRPGREREARSLPLGRSG